MDRILPPSAVMHCMGTQQFSGKLAMQPEACVNGALGHALADTHDPRAQNKTENVGPPWYSAQRLCTQHSHLHPMLTSACAQHELEYLIPAPTQTQQGPSPWVSKPEERWRTHQACDPARLAVVCQELAELSF